MSEMETRSSSVVVVEDDADVRHLLEFNLAEAGFEVHTTAAVTDVSQLAARVGADVVLLDRMLPDGDGVDACRRLRESANLPHLAILMLTARGTEDDRIEGFSAGADDYVVKPFSVREVVARVRVLANLTHSRRAAQRPGEGNRELHRWRNLVVDVTRHRVFAENAEYNLRPLEFALLVTMMEDPLRTFTRDDLLRAVWRDPLELSRRTVDVHVRRLRESLGAFSEVVETIHGVGYRIRAE
jgi:two-component system phosphate regulon response regulator PhoB